MTRVNYPQHPTVYTAPSHLNGHPVIASIALPDQEGLKRGCSIVLVDRGDSEHRPDRYVTGVHCSGEEGWYNGNYLDDLREAIADMADRARGKLGLPGEILAVDSPDDGKIKIGGITFTRKRGSR